jgi:endogenous inhibitor of DNA gyrase (YacG/DUF329 family)
LTGPPFAIIAFFMAHGKAEGCPACGRPAAREGNPWRPFCSERCRMIDLGNWAAERYRIPDRKATGDEAETEVEKKLKGES